VQKHGGSKQVGLNKLGSKQVGFKQLGHKQVGFKQLGHKQVGFKQLGPGVETGVHGVQVEKHVWFKVELQGLKGIVKLSTMPGRQGGPEFEVPAQGKDAEYWLCLSVTPKMEIVGKLVLILT
ncbi:hypothetical protein Tco_0166725, partial [Tanacetum coccineum]